MLSETEMILPFPIQIFCSFFFWNIFNLWIRWFLWDFDLIWVFEMYKLQPLNHLPFDVCLPFQFHSCCVPCLNWHNNMGLVVILWWTCVSHLDENGDVMTRLLNVYDDDLVEFWSLISLTICGAWTEITKNYWKKVINYYYKITASHKMNKMHSFRVVVDDSLQKVMVVWGFLLRLWSEFFVMFIGEFGKICMFNSWIVFILHIIPCISVWWRR